MSLGRVYAITPQQVRDDCGVTFVPAGKLTKDQIKGQGLRCRTLKVKTKAGKVALVLFKETKR